MKTAAASRAARHVGQHGTPKLLDLRPFGTALGAQQVERHRFHQRKALHLVAEFARGFERQGRTIGVAD